MKEKNISEILILLIYLDPDVKGKGLPENKTWFALDKISRNFIWLICYKWTNFAILVSLFVVVVMISIQVWLDFLFINND